jgi:hypothetical protein
MSIELTNNDPTIYSEGLTVERINDLLDKLTAKRFANASVAAQTIRAALDLAGITLPVLEVEGGTGGYFGPTSADGPAILAGISSMTNPTMYQPPSEGEWLFKIKDSDGPDDDFDDTLNLYIVMNIDDENLIECYAQILTDDEVPIIANMDNITDKEYAELVGDRAGETDYDKQIRHTIQVRGDE